MNIDGVIFDLDGVLIDSGDAHYRSWQQVTADHSLTVTQAQFDATFGRQNRDIVPILFGDDVTSEQVEAIGEEKEAIYRDLVRGRLVRVTGAVDLVHACRAAGLKLAIGSSTHPANVELAVAELGLVNCFKATVSSSDVTRGKPFPDVFLAASKALGLEPPQCAVIEDAPSGVEAAKSAECFAIGITTHHPREALSAADWIVDALCELSPERIRSARIA